MLSRGNVANMQQVFDVMSEDEIRDWKARKAMKFFVRTPVFQSSINCSIYA